jgi:hypothetical protein
MAGTMKQVPTEHIHFPVVPHWKTGVKCNGSIMAERSGEQVTLKCNECAAVVGTVNAEILKAWEHAVADQFVSTSSAKPMNPKCSYQFPLNASGENAIAVPACFDGTIRAKSLYSAFTHATKFLTTRNVQSTSLRLVGSTHPLYVVLGVGISLGDSLLRPTESAIPSRRRTSLHNRFPGTFSKPVYGDHQLTPQSSERYPIAPS